MKIPKYFTFGPMLGVVRNVGHVLYRVWFYILVTLPILLFFPLLLLFTISEKTYHQFFWLARNFWAVPILYGMGCFPKIERQQRMEKGKSYMLVANHTSMLDIMLMLIVSRNPFVFVGKKELVSIPKIIINIKEYGILIIENFEKNKFSETLKKSNRIKLYKVALDALINVHKNKIDKKLAHYSKNIFLMNLIYFSIGI